MRAPGSRALSHPQLRRMQEMIARMQAQMQLQLQEAAVTAGSMGTTCEVRPGPGKRPRPLRSGSREATASHAPSSGEQPCFLTLEAWSAAGVGSRASPSCVGKKTLFLPVFLPPGTPHSCSQMHAGPHACHTSSHPDPAAWGLNPRPRHQSAPAWVQSQVEVVSMPSDGLARG